MAGRKWSKEDIEYLEELWGIKSLKNISKKLNRTTQSVRAKAIRLGLGSHLHATEDLSLNILLKELGYKKSYSWWAAKLEKHGCPIKLKKVFKNNFKVVNINDFWKWAEKNQKILNFDRFEENTLGKEPKWVKEKRKKDKNDLTVINKNKKWTKQEDQLLISKIKMYKYTYEELSKEFNRTETAIRKRLYRLNVPYRAVTKKKEKTYEEYFNKECNPRYWTIQEELYLFKNKHKSNKQLAVELNKTEHAISQKKRRLDINLMLVLSEKQGVKY